MSEDAVASGVPPSGAAATAALAAEFEEVTAMRDANMPAKGRATEHDPRWRAIRYDAAFKAIYGVSDEADAHCWRRYRAGLEDCHPHDQHSGCWFPFFRTDIAAALRDERDFVFCVTTNASGREHVRFDWDDEVHSRLAGSVVKKLMDRPPHSAVAPGGGHWVQMGFQSSNFNNDAGRLGAVFVLLQMLFMLDAAPRFASATFRESQPPTMRQYSWALWCIFCSTRTVDAFSRRKLNGLINKEKDVMGVLNLYYLGIFAELFDKWTSQETRDEMHDFQALKQEVTTWSLAHPEQVVKRARVAMLGSKDSHEKVETTGPPLTFSNVEE